MSSQSRGTHLEHRAMDHLADAGYYVIRSAGSHGAADLVAVRPGLCLLVQCKISLERLGSREWTTLYELSQKAGALAIVAYRPTPRTMAFARITGPRALRQRAADLLEVYEP